MVALNVSDRPKGDLEGRPYAHDGVGARLCLALDVSDRPEGDRKGRPYSGSSSEGSGWPIFSASASAVRRGSSPSPRSSSTVTSPDV